MHENMTWMGSVCKHEVASQESPLRLKHSNDEHETEKYQDSLTKIL